MLTRSTINRFGWVALVMLLLIMQAAPALTVRYEAEDAVADENGPYFSTAIAGYSGTGSMVFGSYTLNDTFLNFTVSVPDAGSYVLTIRFCSPFGDKINDLWANGVELTHITFPSTSTWADYPVGSIPLNAGDNIVGIQENWGYMYVDYIEFTGIPATATNPIPENHSTVAVNLTQLCWTNPAPNPPGGTITCNVYFGTTVPNRSLSGYGLTQIATATSATCVNIPSALDPFTTYYWVVDCVDSGAGLLRGFSWDFNTDNSAPIADAGPDQYVTTGVVTLDGSASSDDGLPSATLNYAWQQMSGPAGVPIFPYDTATTSVTLPAVGTYEFRLTVNDTDLDNSDTVQIHVYETHCDVLKAQGTVTLDLGDINEDCIIDFEDWVAFAWYWLECNSAGPCI